MGAFAREVAKASNGVVEALHVEIADKARADAVNASAETKVKTYACVVWFSADRSAEDARRGRAAAASPPSACGCSRCGAAPNSHGAKEVAHRARRPRPSPAS